MLGILCGLEAEAKIAAPVKGSKVVCAAAVPQKARALGRQLVEQGATRLMSFGVAGALDTMLPVGALIIGQKIIAQNGQWNCDAVWVADLSKRLPQARLADVWGSEFLVPTAAEKIALNQSSGCAIVDMESQCAAEVAAQSGLPMAVVRVVCDIANHNVPPMVMSAINSDGSTNYVNVLKGLWRDPAQVIDLLNVGRSMAKALRVLNQAAKALS